MYERVLAGASVPSRHAEVGAGDRVHLLEMGAGPPVVLVPGTGNSAGCVLPLLNELGGPGRRPPTCPGWAERPDRPPTRSLPRDRGRMAGPPARRARVGRRRAAWPLGAPCGRCGTRWLTRTGSSGSCCSVRPRRRSPAAPLPIRLVATPGVGELLSRLAPPSPKSVLRLGSFRLAVAFRVPASFTRATRRIAPGGHAHADGLGRAGAARQRFGRPGSDRADPARRLELPPTGHGPCLGQPAQTAATVVEFVR